MLEFSTFELNGTIKQQWEEKRQRLQYIGNDNKITWGEFGANSWWFEIWKDMGLKVPNKDINEYKCNGAAFEKANQIFNTAVQNRRTLMYGAADYLPTIYQPCVVSFTGSADYGGNKTRKHRETLEPIFFPALCMKVYAIPRYEGNCNELMRLVEKKKQEIYDKFHKNGIRLTRDVFNPMNVGIDQNNRILLLDIEVKGIKYF